MYIINTSNIQYCKSYFIKKAVLKIRPEYDNHNSKRIFKTAFENL